MKTPKRRKRRSHLPSLSQVQRDMMRIQMQANAAIPSSVREAVMASMDSAANPNAENPIVIIASLERDERIGIEQAAQGYQQTLSAVGMRGRNALMFDTSLDELIAKEGDE